jgi:hypothetical protein
LEPCSAQFFYEGFFRVLATTSFTLYHARLLQYDGNDEHGVTFDHALTISPFALLALSAPFVSQKMAKWHEGEA